jgi:hypothetical protein
MTPQGVQRAAADGGPMAMARLAVVPPGLLIERLVVAGEAVSLGARTVEVAHQAAAQRA